MGFNWPKRLTSAERLDREREKTKQRKLRGIVPALLCWDYSSTADGYKYIEHEIRELNPQNRAEVLYKLEHWHGFIIMLDDSRCHYLVVSEAVAAGREKAGWTRATTRKTGLPLPCTGE